MAISTIAMAVFFFLYGVTAVGLLAVPAIILGIVAIVAGIALLLGK